MTSDDGEVSIQGDHGDRADGDHNVGAFEHRNQFAQQRAESPFASQDRDQREWHADDAHAHVRDAQIHDVHISRSVHLRFTCHHEADQQIGAHTDPNQQAVDDNEDSLRRFAEVATRLSILEEHAECLLDAEVKRFV